MHDSGSFTAFGLVLLNERNRPIPENNFRAPPDDSSFGVSLVTPAATEVESDAIFRPEAVSICIVPNLSNLLVMDVSTMRFSIRSYPMLWLFASKYMNRLMRCIRRSVIAYVNALW